MTAQVDVVLPCRDEAAALALLLPRMPTHYRAVVVDNGSRDATAAVARALGALVVQQPAPGYGSAVQAGIEAARPGLVAVLDGDDSLDPLDLAPLVDLVAEGRADLAVGRRRPVGRGTWPLHARAGNALVAARLRRRGIPVHDIAPMRVFDRDALLDLGIADRRSGYPLELLLRAASAGWRIVEQDVAYRPRAAGTRSKVSGSLRGTLTAGMDFRRVLAEATGRRP
ncbi:glycosyltransferase family 2 protein [Spongisporangium articulatum]|uniref:Glycosyltransferase family 2 protein n=1 Tax=Spongisporangium articulatum TaxID=3362603 RepID=A0ABW8AS95_9ACTN